MSKVQRLAPVVYRASPLQRNRCWDLRVHLRTRALDACVSRLIFATACFATVIAVLGGIVCAPADIGAAADASAAAARAAAPRCFREEVIPVLSTGPATS